LSPYPQHLRTKGNDNKGWLGNVSFRTIQDAHERYYADCIRHPITLTRYRRFWNHLIDILRPVQRNGSSMLHKRRKPSFVVER